VDDLHWKSASFLAKNYSAVLIPTFNTQKMVEKKLNKRKINSKTARNMLDLSHYKFKTRLMHLGKKYNSTIIECRENYTSKTCGRCGNINNKLGGNKVYKCNNCGLEMDRDMNGARNILIKNLTFYAHNLF
jgi:putative transposase